MTIGCLMTILVTNLTLYSNKLSTTMCPTATTSLVATVVEVIPATTTTAKIVVITGVNVTSIVRSRGVQKNQFGLNRI